MLDTNAETPLPWHTPLPPLCSRSAEQALAHWQSLAKPPGSLGRLEATVATLAGVQQTPKPMADHAHLWLFAADHGLALDGVTAWPQAVTGGMLGTFAAGGAAINQICRSQSIGFTAVDAGVAQPPKVDGYVDCSQGRGTASALQGQAMGEGQAVKALLAGWQLVQDDPNRPHLLLLGEMGLGNTASASLLTQALTGVAIGDCVGRGAGLDDAGLARKQQVLAEVVDKHGRPTDPLAVLACFGGFEVAMMAGAALAGASRRQTILVDGFIATAAVALACELQPQLRHYCLFCHRSAEPGHQHLLSHLQAEPLLDLSLALGEGSGAALAVGLIRSAVACHRDMDSIDTVLERAGLAE